MSTGRQLTFTERARRAQLVDVTIRLIAEHGYAGCSLQRIAEDDKKSADGKKIALPWIAPWAHKGAPYHRLAIVVLEQNEARKFDVSKLSTIERNGFNLRNFVRSQKLQPLTATLFRTKWDETMAEVMERAGLKEEAKIEFKRKRVEPLPYKRRTERMR